MNEKFLPMVSNACFKIQVFCNNIKPNAYLQFGLCHVMGRKCCQIAVYLLPVTNDNKPVSAVKPFVQICRREQA